MSSSKTSGCLGFMAMCSAVAPRSRARRSARARRPTATRSFEVVAAVEPFLEHRRVGFEELRVVMPERQRLGVEFARLRGPVVLGVLRHRLDVVRSHEVDKGLEPYALLARWILQVGCGGGGSAMRLA